MASATTAAATQTKCSYCTRPCDRKCDVCGVHPYCSGACMDQDRTNHANRCLLPGLQATEIVEACRDPSSKTVSQVFATITSDRVVPSAAILVCGSDVRLVNRFPVSEKTVSLHWSPTPVRERVVRAAGHAVISFCPWHAPVFDEAAIKTAIVVAETLPETEIHFDFQVEHNELVSTLNSMGTTEYLALLKRVTSYDRFPRFNALMLKAYKRLLESFANRNKYASAWTEDDNAVPHGPDLDPYIADKPTISRHFFNHDFGAALSVLERHTVNAAWPHSTIAQLHKDRAMCLAWAASRERTDKSKRLERLVAAERDIKTAIDAYDMIMAPTEIPYHEAIDRLNMIEEGIVKSGGIPQRVRAEDEKKRAKSAEYETRRARVVEAVERAKAVAAEAEAARAAAATMEL